MGSAVKAVYIPSVYVRQICGMILVSDESLISCDWLSSSVG